MRAKQLLGAMLLLAAFPAQAKPHVFEYVKTHKALLLIDAVAVGSAAVESYTSSECLAAMRRAMVTTSTCTKQGSFELRLSPGFLAANHFTYHRAPTRESRYASAVWVGAFAVGSIDAAWTNVQVSSVPYLKKTWGSH